MAKYDSPLISAIHVPLGQPFLSEGINLRLAIEGKNMFTHMLFNFEIFIHSPVNILFKIMLLGKYICYFPQPFCHNKF